MPLPLRTRRGDDDEQPRGCFCLRASVKAEKRLSGQLVRLQDEPDEDYSDAPKAFICPVTKVLMRDPVATVDGHSYEREAIETWIKYNKTSPSTGQKLRASELLPNHALRVAINFWLDERKLKKGQAGNGPQSTASVASVRPRDEPEDFFAALTQGFAHGLSETAGVLNAAWGGTVKLATELTLAAQCAAKPGLDATTLAWGVGGGEARLHRASAVEQTVPVAQQGVVIEVDAQGGGQHATRQAVRDTPATPRSPGSPGSPGSPQAFSSHR